MAAIGTLKGPLHGGANEQVARMLLEIKSPDRLEACGYPSRTTGWGENIAYGYSTGAVVVQAWLNSPGHRTNIENASYRSTGVGAASNASGVLYWSQEFGTYDDSGTGSPPAGSAPTVSLTGGRSNVGRPSEPTAPLASV